uniref:RNase H type-1 domain-containing protein n=1 Tax=Quercus lobata TaxID=97700 RepID=A0A7N2MTJ9_QUELO
MRLSKHADQGANSDQSQMRWFWKKIWDLPLPHKVRHFEWRACRDILPTKVNLMRRKVVNDQFCVECSLEVETTGHMFWTCPRAREVWACSKVVRLVNQERMQSFQDLMWYMLTVERSDVNEVAKLVCIAWAMWHNRNEIRHGGKRRSGAELVRWASQYMEEYKAATEMLVCKAMVADGVRSWIPPSENIFKINVDGAVFADQKAVGVGVIIRDEKGRLEAALSKKILAPLGAVEAEAMAYEQGLMFARDIGIHNFIIEGDSLIIYHALCESSNPPSSVAAVVQGIQEMCREFHGVMFSHVRRQGNQPAHLLAKHACGIVDFIACIQETPCFLEQALIHDVTISSGS